MVVGISVARGAGIRTRSRVAQRRTVVVVLVVVVLVVVVLVVAVVVGYGGGAATDCPHLLNESTKP